VIEWKLVGHVANARVRFVQHFKHIAAQIGLDARLDWKELNTRVAEYQIWILFDRLEQTKVRISTKIKTINSNEFLIVNETKLE